MKKFFTDCGDDLALFFLIACLGIVLWWQEGVAKELKTLDGKIRIRNCQEMAGVQFNDSKKLRWIGREAKLKERSFRLLGWGVQINKRLKKVECKIMPRLKLREGL